MSYPRKLHPLVIEDEQPAKEGYEEIFRSLRPSYDLATPTFARSFAEAKKALEGPSIYHIVILDLGLPWETKQPAVDGLEPGLNLMELVLNQA